MCMALWSMQFQQPLGTKQSQDAIKTRAGRGCHGTAGDDGGDVDGANEKGATVGHRLDLCVSRSRSTQATSLLAVSCVLAYSNAPSPLQGSPKCTCPFYFSTHHPHDLRGHGTDRFPTMHFTLERRSLEVRTSKCVLHKSAVGYTVLKMTADIRDRQR